MKIGGIDPRTLPNEVVLVLPRGDQQIVLTARGLSNWDTFNTLCPEPTAPRRFTPTGAEDNTDDPTYKEMLAEYNKRRMSYIVVASLEPSNIEWETVNLDSPGTWANWEQDMLNGGLNKIEVNRVLGLALEANSLDEAKLKQARDLFVRGQQKVSAT